MDITKQNQTTYMIYPHPTSRPITSTLCVSRPIGSVAITVSSINSFRNSQPNYTRPQTPMQARRCRAIIFDLDDTLIPTSAIDRAAINTAAVAAVGPGDGAEVGARFASLLKDEPFPPRDSILEVSAWRATLWARALGAAADAPFVDATAQHAHDLWAKERLGNFKFSEEVRSLVGRIQAAGYVTGVLTNGHATVQRGKLDACQAADIFPVSNIIAAGEHPEQKPAASIFGTMCDRLGEAADATIMVGDSYAADVMGGINGGLLATVWVRPPNSETSLMHGHTASVPAGKPEPSFVIEGVLKLEAVLEELG